VKVKNKISMTVLVLFVLSLAAGAAFGQMLRELSIGEHKVSVEVADSNALRRKGLMFRENLPENQGMLFVYPETRRLSFWMKNTRIPLDIAFIAADGEILQIEHMQPFDEVSTRSREPAKFALETNQGWFAKHDVRVGAKVVGLP